MPEAEAADVVAALTARGWTLAVAESVTGGLLSAALVAVPGASAVYLGGIVPYATRLKAELLGVPADLLRERGAVDAEVAAAMAHGVGRRLGAAYGIATTGVAGPSEQDGQPVGTVHVAVARVRTGGSVVLSLLLTGDRAAIRRETARAALSLCRDVLTDDTRTESSI